MQQVPLKVFLRWVPQMVALLDKPEAAGVHNILEKVFIFAFKSLCCCSCWLKDKKKRTDTSIYQRLPRNLQNFCVIL